ncbi:hypothetical protein ACET3X_008144 [Alternaria dauci]|uniref:Uncharacterized protein n=1 Tax=Alternaria dauci TaxID=48095 RepID=A0ABR3U9G0_9PLEO
MRSSTCVALFAGAAIAQDSATIFNLFQFDSTLTVLGSDASATTYQKSCPSDNAGISVIPSDLLNTEDPFTPDSTPMPTPAPRMRRQDDAPNDDYSLCEPYTIIQGPETYEMHLTDPTPGAWTVDVACSWQGAMTTADLTCDATNRGIYPGLSTTETKSVLSASELQDMAAYQVVALVTASVAMSGSPTATANPKSRLLGSLTRHVSAPVSPLTLEFCRPREGSIDANHQHALPSPKSPHMATRSKHGLLSELSWAQSLAARLRRDRDNWRSLALKQEQDLRTAHRDLEDQTRSISELEEENAKLRFRHEEDTTAGRQLYSRFHVLISKHDKLVDQFNDAIRTVARLKRSDRTKDNVQQRNLRLKATLQRYTSQGISAATQAAADTEFALREALALANERIEELETTGEALLDALERRNNSCGSDDDGEEMREGDVEAGLLGEEVAFRGVLEDESFKEQKALWQDLLDD